MSDQLSKYEAFYLLIQNCHVQNLMSHESLQDETLKKAHEQFEKKLMTQMFNVYSIHNKLEDPEDRFELSRCIYSHINQISLPDEIIGNKQSLS